MYLLKHPEIKGTTTMGEFKDCVKITSIDFSGGRKIDMKFGTVFRSHGSCGVLGCSVINLTKTFDDSSVQIFDTCSRGKTCDVQLLYLGNNNKKILEINLQDCTLHDFNFMAHGGVPRETFYLAFNRIEFRSLPETGSPRGTCLNIVKGCCD